MKVEILHLRDPDSACDHVVFIDGVRIHNAEITIEDIDPGRGYDRSTWDERIADTETRADYSAPFKVSVLESLYESGDSQYITEG